MSDFFLELAIVMGLTLVISFMMHKINQPLLIGYIISGLLAGPLFLNILSSTEGYQTFSHIGVALLLFIVGLHLNLKLIKEIGFVSFIAGSAQIVITTLFGFLISYLFGFDIFSSFLIAIGISFSSTIVIVKLLSDKRDIDKVYGKLTMGILIIQDLVAVIMLMVLASIANSSESSNMGLELLRTFVFGGIAMVVVLGFSKYVLEKILDSIATSQDLLFIFVISWCLGVSAIFAKLGFSVEVGALLAGVALASSPYQFEISSKVKPLRDFFIVMFFILLGSQMVPVENMSGSAFDYLINNFSVILIPALVLSIFVLLIKPLIIFIVFNILGFHRKVNFLAGLSLGQISEFSLIMILLAQNLGLASSEVISLITLVAIITITFSTYGIMHANKYYGFIAKFLSIFEIRNPKRDSEKDIQRRHEILVFGYDRIGYSLLKSIENIGKDYIVIDYNPEVIKKLQEEKISCIYGDANDIDLLEEFDFKEVQLIISTIPELETAMLVLKEFRKTNKTGTVILTSNDIETALELYKEGADYVILPHFLGGDYMSTMIEKYHGNFQDILKEKVKHIGELKKRKTFGHNHPKNN